MIKTTVTIDGMACSMCEAHINEVIRQLYPEAKKISSSHKTGETVFLTETVPDCEDIRSAIDRTGYRFISCKSEAYEKKGLFFRK